MTVYDPIEVPLDERGGYECGNVVRTPGYLVYRGWKFSGVKVIPADEEDYLYVNVDISFNGAISLLGNDGNLPIPTFFDVGNPNISYKVTIQAIDSTEV